MTQRNIDIIQANISRFSISSTTRYAFNDSNMELEWQWSSALIAAGFVVFACICIALIFLIYFKKENEQSHDDACDFQCNLPSDTHENENESPPLHSSRLEHNLKSTTDTVNDLLARTQAASELGHYPQRLDLPPAKPDLLKSLYQTYRNEEILTLQENLDDMKRQNCDLTQVLSSFAHSREKCQDNLSQLQRELTLKNRRIRANCNAKASEPAVPPLPKINEASPCEALSVCTKASPTATMPAVFEVPALDEVPCSDITFEGNNWRDRLAKVRPNQPLSTKEMETRESSTKERYQKYKYGQTFNEQKNKQ